jgi:hypothetical protein
MSGDNPQPRFDFRPARAGEGQHGLSDASSPVKTSEGRAEISCRSRALSQRQRTVLLLVDGQRTISQIRDMAVQVGAPDTCLDDLLDMGLVALPPVVAPRPRNRAVPLAQATLQPLAMPAPMKLVPAHARPLIQRAEEVQPTASAFALSQPAGESNDCYAVREPHEDRLISALFEEYVQPRARRGAGLSTMDSTPRGGGRIDSIMSSLFPLIESAFGGLSRVPRADVPLDDALEEARRILMREVRSKAPVTGALALMKLRRAATREELMALFDEVGSHISRPMRHLSAQQILRHVKSLLERSN